MLIRVTEPGKPAFELRKGELGLSVFDTDAVTPPVTEGEVLSAFRPGSKAIMRSLNEVVQKGLRVESILGADPLPRRLCDSHREIRPGIGMSRSQFKQALKELEL
jgi:hypothetical protein